MQIKNHFISLKEQWHNNQVASTQSSVRRLADKS